VISTMISGNLVNEDGIIKDGIFGKRLAFNR